MAPAVRPAPARFSGFSVAAPLAFQNCVFKPASIALKRRTNTSNIPFLPGARHRRTESCHRPRTRPNIIYSIRDYPGAKYACRRHGVPSGSAAPPQRLPEPAPTTFGNPRSSLHPEHAKYLRRIALTFAIHAFGFIIQHAGSVSNIANRPKFSLQGARLAMTTIIKRSETACQRATARQRSASPWQATGLARSLKTAYLLDY